MTDSWWFPLVATFVCLCGLIAMSALANCLFKRLSDRAQGGLGGAIIVAFIVYVVFAFAYAILSPSTKSGYAEDDDVAREFTR